MPEAWLVVGLGNPGSAYAGNRHNVGQMVLHELAGRASVSFRNHKANAAIAETRGGVSSPTLVLAKPNSFMNLSGGPVAGVMRFYKIPPTRLIVVHDELDLPFDTLRLKLGGGPGGHNGVRDVIAAIGSPDFIRLRVGVGRPPGRQDPADFVLRDFSSTERPILPNLLADAADAIDLVAEHGLTAAQLKVHTAS